VTSSEDTKPEPVNDTAARAKSARAVKLAAALAILFFIIGVEFLSIAYGGIAWPDLLAGNSYSEYFNYGRSLPMALNLLVFGWLTFGLLAATYFFVTRLTGTQLALPMVAMVNLVVMAGGVIAGVAAIGTGYGVGGRLLEMPWYSDLALSISFLVSAVIVTLTVKRSGRSHVGVPVWYFIAAPWWLFFSFTTGRARSRRPRCSACGSLRLPSAAVTR
jgi:cbb3-type cytochrome oxidase subunit 1